MSGPSTASQEPVENRRALVAHLASGCKPPSACRIGTEHEKFGFRLDDLRPLPYDGPAGIRAMLEGLTRFGWKPFYEGDNVIALTFDGQAVSLEPGGQFELSGAPVENLHQTCNELNTHLAQVSDVAKELGVGFLGLGMQPKWRRDDIPWMPKGRYKVMRRYMPLKGTLGLDMMTRTCTVQVNLDHESEADMVRKMQVGMALQPIATALFANSPFVEGKPCGYLSYRSHIWTDTDPDRCGIPAFVFDAGMSFERYVDYALDVPMYFVMREGKYIDVAGQSFRDFLAGKLPGLPGECPTLADWDDHLTTLFPEVRLKRYIEMRGADGGPWRRLCALPALWTGLLYDSVALDEAQQLCRGWSAKAVIKLRAEVPTLGFKAGIGGRGGLEIARDMVVIARRGLARRARKGRTSADETVYLAPLEEILATGRTAAEALLDAYETRWNRSVDPVFKEFAY